MKREKIYVSQAEFDSLLEYSCSLPTGKTIGKRWKRQNADGWLMGEYVEDPDPAMVGILWRELVVTEEENKDSVTFWAPTWLVQQVRGEQNWPQTLAEQPIELKVIHPDPALLLTREQSLAEAQVASLASLFDRIGRCEDDNHEPIYFRNKVFSTMPYQWGHCDCDRYIGDGHLDDCLSCAPNFWHHSTGLTVNWYKHFGRDVDFPRKTPIPAIERWEEIILECHLSLPGDEEGANE